MKQQTWTCGICRQQYNVAEKPKHHGHWSTCYCGQRMWDFVKTKDGTAVCGVYPAPVSPIPHYGQVK